MTSRKIHGAKIQIHIAACNWRDGRSQSDRSNAADRQPFLPRATLPVEIPYHELTAAEKLVNDCGNHRRNQDLPMAIYFEPPHVGCYASTAPASCLNSGYLLN